MKKHSVSALLLVAALMVSACENQLEPSNQVSVNTKGALELLPSDAVFVGMVNPDAMNANAFIQDMQEEAFSLERVSGEMDATMRDFLDATGFDPLEDVREMYVALSSDEEATMAVYADISADKFEAFADERLDNDLAKTEYGGVNIYSDGNFFVAFVNDELLVASSSEDGIQETIDRLSSDSPSLSDDSRLSEMIGSVGTKSAWFVAKDFDHMRQHSDHSDMDEMHSLMRVVNSAAFGIDAEASGVRVRALLTPIESASSDDLASMARGAVAGMKASAKNDAKAMSMLDGVSVQRAGNDVTIDAFVANSILESSDKY